MADPEITLLDAVEAHLLGHSIDSPEAWARIAEACGSDTAAPLKQAFAALREEYARAAAQHRPMRHEQRLARIMAGFNASTVGSHASINRLRRTMTINAAIVSASEELFMGKDDTVMLEVKLVNTVSECLRVEHSLPSTAWKSVSRALAQKDVYLSPREALATFRRLCDTYCRYAVGGFEDLLHYSEPMRELAKRMPRHWPASPEYVRAIRQTGSPPLTPEQLLLDSDTEATFLEALAGSFARNTSGPSMWTNIHRHMGGGYSHAQLVRTFHAIRKEYAHALATHTNDSFRHEALMNRICIYLPRQVMGSFASAIRLRADYYQNAVMLGPPTPGEEQGDPERDTLLMHAVYAFVVDSQETPAAAWGRVAAQMSQRGHPITPEAARVRFNRLHEQPGPHPGFRGMLARLFYSPSRKRPREPEPDERARSRPRLLDGTTRARALASALDIHRANLALAQRTLENNAEIVASLLRISEADT